MIREEMLMERLAMWIFESLLAFAALVFVLGMAGY